MTRAQWAQDLAWDTRHDKTTSFTVSARRLFVGAQEFRRVTVRDNETGAELERDYLPNLTTESECLADAFTLAMGEGRWSL